MTGDVTLVPGPDVPSCVPEQDAKVRTALATSNRNQPAMPRAPSRAASGAAWLDNRIDVARSGRGLVRKVFPGHQSFMLGEIAL
jgi:hypothetical protein